jgi:hypothetical protein
MSRAWRKFDVILLLVAFGSLSLHAQSQPNPRKAPKAKAPELEVETVTPPPQPPPKPPTPAQLPAKPPEVILEDRQLWILADNSTLGDILNLVRTRTGAVIEVTSGDVSERVMGRFGPGPARDVLSALLNGSHFNYVLTSPGDDPTGLSHVVLIPKPAGGAAVAGGGGQVFQGAAPQAYRAPAPVYSPPPQVPPQAEQPADDQNDQVADGSEADQSQQAQPGENGEQQGSQPTVKTPEQLLQELQKQQQLLLQQQRQQQQQQQGSNDQQPDSQDPQD